MSQKWLFLLYLTIVSDIVASALGAYKLYRHENGRPLAVAIAIALTGIAGEGLLLFAANTFPRTMTFSTGYAVLFWIGRGFKSICVWTLVLYIIGFRMPKGGR